MDKYAKTLPKYKVGTHVLVRNFTRKPLERKFSVDTKSQEFYLTVHMNLGS